MSKLSFERPKAQAMSVGLWRNRVDIQALLDVQLSSPISNWSHCNSFVGWGLKKSGLHARQRAQQHGGQAIILEDGFLKGFSNTLKEPAQSYVVDRSGIYFDTRTGNDFETILVDQVLTDLDCHWAHQMMDYMRRHRITKFNNWPQISATAAGLPTNKKFVLVVDQIEDDASIVGASANRHSFERMLVAAHKEALGRQIVVRTHPAAMASSPLIKAALGLNIPVIVPKSINPWCLLEEADAVYTISSQLGFEALMCGKPVVCFGQNFYAGRGMTDDRFTPLGLRKKCSIEEMFFGFHRSYAQYLDIHSRDHCSLEHALEQTLFIRNQRSRILKTVFTGGLSPWKRKAIGPFLVGSEGKARHKLTFKAALSSARKENGIVAVWGAAKSADDATALIYLEDGFIRSIGLGVRLTLPSSLAIDYQGAHYDASKQSDLIQLLNTMEFDTEIIRRSQMLCKRLIEGGITKYNTQDAIDLPEVAATRVKILVPGQVEADASIRFGAADVRTNEALVARVRIMFPNAYIVYKLHPDVVAGLRSGGDMPTGQDLTVKHGSSDLWLNWCDRVETMTSFTGFEALVRNKQVGIHGRPVYAGWGLTDDYAPISGRARKLNLYELIAGMLISYPFYIHPESRLPIPVEALVEYISKQTQDQRQPTKRFRQEFFIFINRIAIKIRDRL